MYALEGRNEAQLNSWIFVSHDLAKSRGKVKAADLLYQDTNKTEQPFRAKIARKLA